MLTEQERAERQREANRSSTQSESLSWSRS